MNTDPLQKPREEIDAIDAEIIALLGKRWQLVEEVTRIKQEHNLPPLQPERFAELMKNLLDLSKDHDLPTSMIEELWHTIHVYSRRSQGEHDAH